MAEYSLTVTGLERLQAQMAALGNMTPALAQGLMEHAETVMTDSKESYVPVDLGILRASGTVLPPVISGHEVEVTLGFGGQAEAYALVQHENLSYHHDDGGPKYLERPMLAHANELPERLKEAVEAAVTRVA